MVLGHPRTYVLDPGDEIELANDAALPLLREGSAVRVESVPETAAVSRGEKAVRQQARPIR